MAWNERIDEDKGGISPMKSFLPVSLFLFAAVMILPGLSLSAPFPGRLGVEASGDAFVDLARQCYRWEKNDGHGGWSTLKREDVDAHGWPTSDCHWVLDARPCAEWAGQIDDPEAYRIDLSGLYHGTFAGKAKLGVGAGSSFLGKQTYDTASNRTTFELTLPKPGPNHGLVVLEFKETQRNTGSPVNTGISGFRLIRPGYSADTKQVFTSAYLACLKSAAFSTIRFMAVTNTNGNVQWGKDHTRLQSWNNRKVVEDASVEAMDTLDKKDGWPWEDVIGLCNQANMDAWINIPIAADDDYIFHLAVQLKSTLKPTLNIYIEHSNEVWTFGFIQYAWNKAKAKEEVKEGSARYDFDQVNNEEIWAQRRHAQRVRDAVEVFGGVFGKESINKRVRGVLAGITPDPAGFFVCGRLAGMLDYLKTTNGDPKNYLYAISIPAYYGGKAASGDTGTENASVDQILTGMKANVEQTKKDRAAVVGLAKRFELPGGYCAYESGPDIGGGRTSNVANRIRAIRDGGQKDIYKANLADAFWGVGGNLAMQFTLSGSYSRYGAWGLTDDVSKPDRSALFQAARDLVGANR